MDLVETLRTTGAVREYLPDPVPDEVVHRVLDTARFAPSGGNRQGWRAVVVHDPAIRRQIRDLYLDDWYRYLAMRQNGLVPFHVKRHCRPKVTSPREARSTPRRTRDAAEP